jgi:hypothetical protein
MQISVRMEGGLGDHLLANRFVPAILDKHKDAKVKLYSDSNGGTSNAKVIKKFFSRFYESIEIIPNKKNEKSVIHTRFGIEEFPASLNNIPDEYIDKFNSSDKFYDLHIDGLKWFREDFDWLRYYYFFPKPEENAISQPAEDNYILCHLYSRPTSPYNIDKGYVSNLLKKVSLISNIVVITQEDHKNFYSELFDIKNIKILTPNIEECFSLASNCSAFIGIDSGIRYIPYHYSKPVFVFSHHCKNYGVVNPAHSIRWLLFEKAALPINMDIDIVSKILYNSISYSPSWLFPNYIENLDIQIIDRNL